MSFEPLICLLSAKKTTQTIPLAYFFKCSGHGDWNRESNYVTGCFSATMVSQPRISWQPLNWIGSPEALTSRKKERWFFWFNVFWLHRLKLPGCSAYAKPHIGLSQFKQFHFKIAGQISKKFKVALIVSVFKTCFEITGGSRNTTEIRFISRT